MTAIQMNAELLRNMSIIAEGEKLPGETLDEFLKRKM